MVGKKRLKDQFSRFKSAPLPSLNRWLMVELMIWNYFGDF